MKGHTSLVSGELETRSSEEPDNPLWSGYHTASAIKTHNEKVDQELVDFLDQSQEYIFNYIGRSVDDAEVAHVLFNKVELAVRDHWLTYRPQYGLRAMLIWARDHARTLAAEHLAASGLHPCSKRHFEATSPADSDAAHDLFRLLQQPLFRVGDFKRPIPR